MYCEYFVWTRINKVRPTGCLDDALATLPEGGCAFWVIFNSMASTTIANR